MEANTICGNCSNVWTRFSCLESWWRNDCRHPTWHQAGCWCLSCFLLTSIFVLDPDQHLLGGLKSSSLEMLSCASGRYWGRAHLVDVPSSGTSTSYLCLVLETDGLMALLFSVVRVGFDEHGPRSARVSSMATSSCAIPLLPIPSGSGEGEGESGTWKKVNNTYKQ